MVRPSSQKQTADAADAALGEARQFSDADLADFRRRLINDREKIKSQMRNTRANALASAGEENVEEDGTNTFTRAADLSRADEQNNRLHAIEEALRAIDKKTYGICQVCGCLIPRDRLKAAPFAIRCVTCKAEYEKNLATAKRAQNL